MLRGRSLKQHLSCLVPCFQSQPSRSGLKKVCIRSLPSSSGILNGSLLMLSYKLCQFRNNKDVNPGEYEYRRPPPVGFFINHAIHFSNNPTSSITIDATTHFFFPSPRNNTYLEIISINSESLTPLQYPPPQKHPCNIITCKSSSGRSPPSLIPRFMAINCSTDGFSLTLGL